MDQAVTLWPTFTAAVYLKKLRGLAILWRAEAQDEDHRPDFAEALEVIALAIEYVRLKDGDGWGYVASTVKRWAGEGSNLADALEEIKGERNAKEPRKAGPTATPAQVAAQKPDAPLTPDEERKLLTESAETARKLPAKWRGRTIQDIRAAIARGIIGEELLVGLVNDRDGPAQKEPAAGSVTKLPPRPAPERCIQGES